MLDSNDWRNYQWTYTANYDYEFIYLGYVGNTDDATTNSWSTDASIGYYVWFDMVMVIAVDSVEIDAMHDFKLCQDSTANLSASCNVFYEWAWDDGSGNMQFSYDSYLLSVLVLQQPITLLQVSLMTVSKWILLLLR